MIYMQLKIVRYGKIYNLLKFIIPKKLHSLLSFQH